MVRVSPEIEPVSVLLQKLEEIAVAQGTAEMPNEIAQPDVTTMLLLRKLDKTGLPVTETDPGRGYAVRNRHQVLYWASARIVSKATLQGLIDLDGYITEEGRKLVSREAK
jgi:hypothetical protein